MSSAISVIICTHNPRSDYLERVLGALRDQTLCSDDWEFLLIDNASATNLADKYDLSWHPNSRHIRENTLGLTPARLRGIAESQGDLLVFVDDDNILDPDYLEHVARIEREYPFLGVWGGSATGEFETPPEAWAVPYLPFLAIRDCHRDSWANLLVPNESIPNGAGMCVRRRVANQYAAVAADSAHQLLGRRGSDLTGCEDHALMFVGCQMGLGTGSFVALHLTHLIPSVRVSEQYLLRLMERNEFSYAVLMFLQNGSPPTVATESLSRRILNWVKNLSRTRFERQMESARRRGRIEGARHVGQLSRAALEANEKPATGVLKLLPSKVNS
jgi:glycosyltransferase involved in cell wall biosynthesis